MPSARARAAARDGRVLKADAGATLNALSFDVEDWYHAELIRHNLEGEPRPQVEECTRPILALLELYGIRATFFVVGEVAVLHPSLIREIGAAGHEIACHGMSHRPLWDMQPDDFRQELEAFVGVVGESVDTTDVVGYRAPTFSLDNERRWAIGVLKEYGYRYDSSIFPVRTPLYGVDGCPAGPYYPSEVDITVDAGEGDFVEFPLSALRIGNLAIPVCGGFYLRAIPYPFLYWALRQINRQGQPFVLYMHPWETCRDTVRVRSLSPLSYFVTYYNISSALHKLERLLATFRFAPLREVLEV